MCLDKLFVNIRVVASSLVISWILTMSNARLKVSSKVYTLVQAYGPSLVNNLGQLTSWFGFK